MEMTIACAISYWIMTSGLVRSVDTPSAALIGIGTVVMMLLDRREDIISTAITTTVVMVVAAISPQDAWQQPILRLIDIIVGIAGGIGCIRIASLFRIGKRA